jgi:SAM domain (Sterile alpha motif)
MTEIQNWLESIGLGQYADAFDANEIGMDLLGKIDDQMLKDIGVSIGGHRLRIRNAIAKLTAVPVAEVNVSATTPTLRAWPEPLLPRFLRGSDPPRAGQCTLGNR